MLQVTLRLRHDCALADLSARNPRVAFAGWCNWHRDVLEARVADPEDLTRFAADLGALRADGFDVLPGTDAVAATPTRWVLRCGHEPRRTIDEILSDHGCLLFPPVTYRAGWEEYRFVALTADSLPGAYAELTREGAVEVVRKRPFEGSLLESGFFLTSLDLVGDLTSKQLDALRAAIAQGYYAVPRRTRFQDIADRLSVPRTTLEEHVRKAEAKVLHAVAPYLASVPDGRQRRKTRPRPVRA